jgi:hypothetical protein
MPDEVASRLTQGQLQAAEDLRKWFITKRQGRGVFGSDLEGQPSWMPSGPELRALLSQAAARTDAETQEALEVALNSREQEIDWTERLAHLAEERGGSDATARRRVDGALQRLANGCAEAYSTDPYELDLSRWHDTVSRDGLGEVHFIVGSTSRESLDAAAAFGANAAEINLAGGNIRIHRQFVPATTRDFARIADIAAALATGAPPVRHPQTTQLCIADLAVSRQHLEGHIILVGAADTNLWFAVASLAMAQEFDRPPPIGYGGDSSRYFTCDEIVSGVSGRKYQRLEESGGMHCGYVLFCRNPWNRERTLTIASGIRATGTQAALLALTGQVDAKGKSLDNNSFDESVSARVVRATRAQIVAGDAVISGSTEVDIEPTRRVSQRHQISSYLFVE